MTWIALVGPELEENLSLRYLASSLQSAGFEARIIRFDGDEDFPRAAQAIVGSPEPPLLVGISLAFQWRAPDFLALAVGLRSLGYRGHLTVGGHFATFAAEPLLTDFPALDSVCRQEAELTLVSLCRSLEAGAPWPTSPAWSPEVWTAPWCSRRCRRSLIWPASRDPCAASRRAASVTASPR